MHIRENVYGANSTENELSFEDVVAQNQDKIVNLIYGMTGNYHLAQDLTQETFVKAFRAMNSFNGKSKLSTWLYRIAVNVTIDWQRKCAVQKESPAEELEACGGGQSDPDQACQKRAIKEILYAAIAQLPEQQKEVFILREINGCSTKEVAEILDIGVELVKWRLHKARSSMRKILQADNKYQNTGSFTLNSFGLE